MNTISKNFSSIDEVRGLYLSDNVKKTEEKTDTSFEDILKLKFSKHASLRLSDRGIDLTNDQTKRLSNGIEKAKDKGIQESLVLMDELAFIVNVDKSTVITAMDKTDSDIFTNIDGAVIV